MCCVPRAPKEQKEGEPIWPRRLLIARPRGFCAGVVNAIDILELARQRHPGRKVYTNHDIVHNKHVVKEFEEKGILISPDLDQLGPGDVLVLSPHGVRPEIIEKARQKGLIVYDATCPLVEKPHREVREHFRQGRLTLYIGHRNHPEAVGTMGQVPAGWIVLIETEEDALKVEVPDPEKVALTTQTTLSLDDTARIRGILKRRFPRIIEPKAQDICYATQNRQNGVKKMIELGAQVLVVVGSQNSSNSNRLREVGEARLSKLLGQAGLKRAFLVDEASELNVSWFYGFDCVGLTSGASAPENKLQEVVSWFLGKGTSDVREVSVADEERIRFALPKELRQ